MSLTLRSRSGPICGSTLIHTMKILIIAALVALSFQAEAQNCGKGKGNGNACTGKATSTAASTATSSSFGGTGGSAVGTGVNTQSVSTEASRIAIAPSMSPTANCAMTAAIGVSGLSLGGSHIDANCAAIEAAKALAQLGKLQAAHEALCEIPAVRTARNRTGEPCFVDTIKVNVEEPTDPYVRRRLGLN
jgi:hypothetical protein